MNQNYQPLLVCPARLPICLMYLGAVELVERYRAFVHSPSVVFPLPSVIKLAQYIRTQKNDIVLSRRNILKRDQHQCQYCSKRSVPMTLDHILPKERGGSDSWENLVACCQECNRKKGNRRPVEAKMPLIRRPKKPNRIYYIRQFVKREQTAWRPYLYMEPLVLDRASA